jgi:SAM-dependent methyltransferase
MDAAALAEFYASGRHDVDLVLQRSIRFLGEWSTPARALDFGCGVGRLTYAMAAHAGEVVGYDVSPAMLNKAEARNEGSVTFTSAWPDGDFDWINSFIVFQHIAPERGLTLLNQLLRSLRPGGLVSLHFTIYRDAHLVPERSVRAATIQALRRWLGRPTGPPPGSVTMYDYDLGKVAEALIRAGVDESAMFHADHGGHHGVQIIGRRR